MKHHQTLKTGIILAALGSQMPAMADEVTFEKVGRWSVEVVSHGGKFSYCTADVDNGKVQLRLTTSDGAWHVGVPYYENKRKVAGHYGFGDAAEQANFSVTTSGWAFLAINSDQVRAFSENPSFSIHLDRGLQTWQLSGARAAIEKARECAQNKGEKKAESEQAIPPKTGKNCPPVGKYRTPEKTVPAKATFYNGSAVPVDLYWIKRDGRWVKYGTLGPDQNVRIKTYTQQPWVATDARGNCFPEVFLPDAKGDDEHNNFQVHFR